jgi:hypothetical protein
MSSPCQPSRPRAECRDEALSHTDHRLGHAGSVAAARVKGWRVQFYLVPIAVSKLLEGRYHGQANIRHLRLLRPLRDGSIPGGGGRVRGAYSPSARGRAAGVSLLFLYRAPEFSRLLRDRPQCLPHRLGKSYQRPSVRPDDLPAALPPSDPVGPGAGDFGPDFPRTAGIRHGHGGVRARIHTLEPALQ